MKSSAEENVKSVVCNIINSNFNRDDIYDLFLYFGLDYRDYSGDSARKMHFIDLLVKELESKNLLDKLVEECQERNPSREWPEDIFLRIEQNNNPTNETTEYNISTYINKLTKMISEDGLRKGGDASVINVAQTETVSALKKLSYVGRKRVMQFLEENNLVGQDGVNFYRADFEGANLEGIYFKFVDLRNANLKNTNLTDAIFFKCDLKGADFHNSNAAKIGFVESKLKDAKFSDANLQNSNFFAGGPFFRGIDFTNADMNGARFIDVYLYGIDFTDADLSGVNFRGSTTLDNVIFLDTNITAEQILQVKYKDIISPIKVTHKLWANEGKYRI